jgi:hypothetical protein
MADVPETIKNLSRELTINEILLASQEFNTIEEMREYLKTLLKGAKSQ